MLQDYIKTAEKMFEGAKALYEKKQWHCACYLAGYVVEALLNAVIEKKGLMPPRPVHLNHNTSLIEPSKLIMTMKLSPGNTLEKDYPALFDTSFSGYPNNIIKGFTTSGGLHCDKWYPTKRYEPSCWDSEEMAEAFISDIDNLDIKKLITDLKLGGLV